MRMRSCEVMQYIEYMNLSPEGIKNILESKSMVKDYAIILHDKDIDTKPHYHIAIRFNNVVDYKNVAKWFGIEEQYVGKVKGRWQDILKYLTHENAPMKYQYSTDDVVCNFDYNQAKEDGLGRKEEIMQRIVNGEIREFNLHKEINIIEYDKYRKSIENAFLYRQKFLKEKSEREMEVVFISGVSGSGKTTQAKMMCESQNYSYFVSSSSNDPFDGYEGQDAIILDDLRGSSFSFADLLKITDNHTSSSVKSRYKNKILECRLIIITSILPIEEFYSNVFESSEEPLIQFKRRCQTYIQMTRKLMRVSYFDKDKDDYVVYRTVQNPVAKYFEFNKAKTIEHRVNIISNLLGSALDYVIDEDFEDTDEQIEW